MNELEKSVLDIIERRYKKKYTGGIQVQKLESGGFKLVLNLGVPDKPMIQIAANLDEANFLKYVEQELISRQLHKVEFFTGIKYEEVPRTC